MKKIMIMAAVVSAVLGSTAAVQAQHNDWVKTIWQDVGGGQ